MSSNSKKPDKLNQNDSELGGKMVENFDITIDDIRSDALSCLTELNSQSKQIGLFKINTCNNWLKEAKKQKVPEMLFDEFWYEGEICILFADTNVGKSILAIQIGDSISKGEPIKNFRLTAGRQKIVYIDFEMSSKQFETRYSNKSKDHYLFDDDFERTELNPDPHIADKYDDESQLYNSIEEIVSTTQTKILIIDNITYLRHDTEKAKDALPLMKKLKSLKTQHGLSILVLAHTPKRNPANPLTQNDLQGSKMLINFCDSAFAIGESSKEVGMRYLKQIKARNTSIKYGANNVPICKLNKPNNFVCFEFIKFGSEKSHLRSISKDENRAVEEKIISLFNSNSKMSRADIARELDIYPMKVSRVLNKLS